MRPQYGPERIPELGLRLALAGSWANLALPGLSPCRRMVRGYGSVRHSRRQRHRFPRAVPPVAAHAATTGASMLFPDIP